MSNPYAPPEDRPREAAPDGPGPRGAPPAGQGGTAQSGTGHGGTAQGGTGHGGTAPAGAPQADPPATAHGAPRGDAPLATLPPPPPGAPHAGPVGPAGRSPEGVPYERARGGPPPGPAASPTDVARISRLSRATSWLVLLAVLADLLPFPWYVGAAPVAVAALVVGARALSVAARTRQRGPRSVLGLLLVVAVLCLARPTTALLTWPAQAQLADCQTGALTVQAQNACLSEYQKALEDLAGQLTRRTP